MKLQSSYIQLQFILYFHLLLSSTMLFEKKTKTFFFGVGYHDRDSENVYLQSCKLIHSEPTTVNLRTIFSFQSPLNKTIYRVSQPTELWGSSCQIFLLPLLFHQLKYNVSTVNFSTETACFASQPPNSKLSYSQLKELKEQEQVKI